MYSSMYSMSLVYVVKVFDVLLSVDIVYYCNNVVF